MFVFSQIKLVDACHWSGAGLQILHFHSDWDPTDKIFKLLVTYKRININSDEQAKNTRRISLMYMKNKNLKISLYFSPTSFLRIIVFPILLQDSRLLFHYFSNLFISLHPAMDLPIYKIKLENSNFESFLTWLLSQSLQTHGSSVTKRGTIQAAQWPNLLVRFH